MARLLNELRNLVRSKWRKSLLEMPIFVLIRRVLELGQVSSVLGWQRQVTQSLTRARLHLHQVGDDVVLGR